MPVRSLTVVAILALVATGPAASQQSTPGSHGGHGAAGAGPAVPLYPNLGAHHYRIRASEDAQRYFDQGLRLHWAFNHAAAINSFREAERRDPSCGLCPWGIALAAGPNINAPMEPGAIDTALAALERARSVAGLSGAEHRLIEALAARYRPGPPGDRAALDSAWAREIGALAAGSPDDLEIATLAAEALMNLSPWNYWGPGGAPRPATPTILGYLERVIERNPGHPGACHLFIHAVEAREPARALPCAERLAGLMPGAGHLVHMPGHIYVRVGRYADAVEANRHAVHADRSFLEGPASARRDLYASGYYPHNHHFLAFAAAMMGASQLAIQHAFAAADGVAPEIAARFPWIEAITPIGYWTLVTFGRWDQILAEPLPPAEQRFTTGMAYYARGAAFAARRRWAEARAALDSVSRIAGAHPAGENRVALEIAEHAVAGEIAYRRGHFPDAIRSFKAAVALEDGLPYTEPPTWYYPVRQSLGKAYLAAGRALEAERVYREDLERFPENGWSLYGLAAALKRQGRTGAAIDAVRRFNAAWVSADVRLVASRY